MALLVYLWYRCVRGGLAMVFWCILLKEAEQASYHSTCYSHHASPRTHTLLRARMLAWVVVPPTTGYIPGLNRSISLPMPPPPSRAACLRYPTTPPRTLPRAHCTTHCTLQRNCDYTFTLTARCCARPPQIHAFHAPPRATPFSFSVWTVFLVVTCCDIYLPYPPSLPHHSTHSLHCAYCLLLLPSSSLRMRPMTCSPPYCYATAFRIPAGNRMFRRHTHNTYAV